MEYFFNFDKLDYLTGKRPEGCILCLVSSLSTEVVQLVVHESPLVIVSLNLYPYNPGHLILFPRRHLHDIRELSGEERLEMDALTRLSLDVLDSTHHPGGYNIGYNMGPVAGASIEHIHQHIIPRYPREIGISELLAGKRVLVQDINETKRVLAEAFAKSGEGRK